MNKRLTQLHTEPFTAEREWAVDGLPVLTAAVSLPQPVPAADRVSRRIRRYYRLQSRSFLHYCESWLLPQAAAEARAALAVSAPLTVFHAELCCQVTYNAGGLWSLYTQSRETGVQGRSVLSRRSDTWDLSAGYPVPLADFFPRGQNWKRPLLAAVESEAARREAAGAARFHPDWRRALRRQFNPQNFYLTEDGLALFYPMYAIAPGQEGIPVFTLPLPNRLPGSAPPNGEAPP